VLSEGPSSRTNQSEARIQHLTRCTGENTHFPQFHDAVWNQQ